LLVLNTAFVPAFTILVEKLQPYIAPLIATLCFIGVYMLNYSFFDVGLMILFGVIGYFFKKFHFPLAPLILAIVLGSMLETNFRKALLISHGNLSIFFIKPISLTLIIITVIIVLLPLIQRIYTIIRHKG